MVDVVGYVQNVSPEKTSKDGKRKFVDFSIQTAGKTFKRAVCFDSGVASSIRQFEADHSPIKIRNCTRSGDDYLLNKRCKIEEASNHDVDYEYMPNNQAEATMVVIPVTRLSEISQSQEGKVISCTGLFVEISDEEKTVRIGRRSVSLREKCALIDITGWLPLTIWETDFPKLVNGMMYHFSSLAVKQFGTLYLSTTPHTVIDHKPGMVLPEETVALMTARALEGVGIARKRIDQFSYADNFSVNFLCRSCQKRLTDISTLQVIKCTTPFCQISQRIRDCRKVPSVRLAIEEDGEQIWLTMKGQPLIDMLAQLSERFSREVTVESAESDILSLILEAADFDIEYDLNTRVLRSVTI